MTAPRALESRLERLLSYGTALCTGIIALGVALDMFDVQFSSIDLVSVGTVGFITLPVLRIATMLRHYLATKDIAMAKVVVIVLALVMVGLIIGMFL